MEPMGRRGFQALEQADKRVHSRTRAPLAKACCFFRAMSS